MMKTVELWFLRKIAVLLPVVPPRKWRCNTGGASAQSATPGKTPGGGVDPAHAQAALGHPGEAVGLLHRSLEMDPAQPGNWFNLGYLLQQAGADDDAVAAFAQALALDPKLDRAWYGQALSLIALGRVEEAVAALRRNTELQPLSPYGWYQLAHACAAEPARRGGIGDPSHRQVRAQGGATIGTRDGNSLWRQYALLSGRANNKSDRYNNTGIYRHGEVSCS